MAKNLTKPVDTTLLQGVLNVAQSSTAANETVNALAEVLSSPTTISHKSKLQRLTEWARNPSSNEYLSLIKEDPQLAIAMELEELTDATVALENSVASIDLARIKPNHNILADLVKADQSFIDKIKAKDGAPGQSVSAKEVAKLIAPTIKTPRKGVDYFTNEDIADIIDEVLEAIPKPAAVPVVPVAPTVVKEFIPDTGVEIRDKLELLEGDERLQVSAINGLEDYEKLWKKVKELDDNQGNVGSIVNYNTGSTSSLTVEEIDASPSISSVSKLIFPSGTLTDNGGGVATVNISGSSSYGVVHTSLPSYTASPLVDMVIVDVSVCTVTIPVSTVKMYTVKNASGGAAAITIQPSTGQIYDRNGLQSSASISDNGEAMDIVSDGTNLYVK